MEPGEKFYTKWEKEFEDLHGEGREGIGGQELGPGKWDDDSYYLKIYQVKLPKKNNDIIYTAADIERYHRGQLSAKEMHAIEKAALDDPLLADALEGYATNQASVPPDIDDLKARLAQRVKEEKSKIVLITKNKSSFSWWKVAAMFVIIAGAGWIVYQFGFNKNETDIAQAVPNKATESPAKDSVKPASPITVPVDSGKGSEITTQLQKKETEQSETEQEVKTPVPKALEFNTKSKLADTGITESAPATPLTNRIPGIAIDKKQEIKNENAGREIASAVKEEEFRTPDDTRARTLQARKAKAAEGYFKNAEGQAYKTPNVFRGRVTDAYNNALPFSNITNTRDSIGTYADANGFFNLISPDSVLNVKVSSIGFETSTVELYNNIPANRIKLEEDQASLSEVVISSKKVNSTRAKNNNMVLEEAEPADGWSNYDLYLANNLKEPGDLKEKKPTGIHGEVELSFEVNKSGEPINITVKKSLCEACDKEAIRLVKEGPKWKRKARKGKTTVTIPF